MFDPSKPADHAPLVSSEMRSQLNGLNQNVNDTAQNAANNLSAAVTGTSNNSNAVDFLNISLSNPPQQWEVQPIIDKLNELITALRR